MVIPDYFSLRRLFMGLAIAAATAVSVLGQATQRTAPSVIVQPGAPGEATKTLPASTRAALPPMTMKDVDFMQGMIMHHAQAVEMTALIADRTSNQDIKLLGERISLSQSDEMAFMTRWLVARGQPAEMKIPASDSRSAHSHGDHGSKGHLMPGMLSAEQMTALRNASGNAFDVLFLKGMIQHHEGALVMVDELFKTAGAGQDAELFNFASDVDSGQRAEIRSMQNLLGNSRVKH